MKKSKVSAKKQKENQHVRLSKQVCDILRHSATKHHLIMDSRGFLPLYAVARVLACKQGGDQDEKGVNRLAHQIKAMARLSKRDQRMRFTLRREKGVSLIRANYGHSGQQLVLLGRSKADSNQALPPIIEYASIQHFFATEKDIDASIVKQLLADGLTLELLPMLQDDDLTSLGVSVFVARATVKRAQQVSPMDQGGGEEDEKGNGQLGHVLASREEEKKEDVAKTIIFKHQAKFVLKDNKQRCLTALRQISQAMRTKNAHEIKIKCDSANIHVRTINQTYNSEYVRQVHSFEPLEMNFSQLKATRTKLFAHYSVHKELICDLGAEIQQLTTQAEHGGTGPV